MASSLLRSAPLPFPTETSRIRVTVTSEHSTAQIDQALAGFEQAGQAAGVSDRTADPHKTHRSQSYESGDFIAFSSPCGIITFTLIEVRHVTAGLSTEELSSWIFRNS